MVLFLQIYFRKNIQTLSYLRFRYVFLIAPRSALLYFEKNILDRTGKSEATQVLSHIFYDNGPGLRGLVLDEKSRPLATEKMAWSLRINQELPYIPGDIFFDIGGITEGKSLFIVSGLQLGPFLLPFYQSWELEHKFPNNGQWVLDRLRLDFNVSLPFGFNI